MGSKLDSTLTQRETLLEDFDPTGEAGAKAMGTLTGSKLGSTLTPRETQRLEDFDPTAESPPGIEPVSFPW